MLTCFPSQSPVHSNYFFQGFPYIYDSRDPAVPVLLVMISQGLKHIAKWSANVCRSKG